MGIVVIALSVFLISNDLEIDSALFFILACESLTNFGLPVLPEVLIIKTKSSLIA